MVVPRSSFQPTCEFGSDRVLVYEELSGPKPLSSFTLLRGIVTAPRRRRAAGRHDDALPTALSPRIIKASTTTCGLE